MNEYIYHHTTKPGKVSSLETELGSLTGKISQKKEELNTLKMKIVESGGVR